MRSDEGHQDGLALFLTKRDNLGTAKEDCQCHIHSSP
jgi:hypothetical protein